MILRKIVLALQFFLPLMLITGGLAYFDWRLAIIAAGILAWVDINLFKKG